jgi:hypothetical protein
MPYLGILIYACQLGCLVHAVRSGRSNVWFYLLLFAPGLGIAAYVLVELLPEWLNLRPVRDARKQLVDKVDPERRLRPLRQAHEDLPTAANKVPLAEELLRLGRPEEALPLLEESMVGLHADDPTFARLRAEALLMLGRPQDAIDVLTEVAGTNSEAADSKRRLVHARALCMMGCIDDGIVLLRQLLPVFAGEEVRAWLARAESERGDKGAAETLWREILTRAGKSTRSYRAINKAWIDEAREGLGQTA